MDDFRSRVADWMRSNADAIPRGDDAYANARQMQRMLYDAGLAGITWPVEYGGQGLTMTEQRIFDDEAQAYDLPLYPLTVGTGMIAPTLLELGSAQQRAQYVGGIARGEIVGCQLFSEPEAGSDLAALRTRAVPESGGWLINGQKVWTTHAHRADIAVLLARTDPDAPKHAGITMFLVDMRAPGVRVRPLRDMTGEAPFNEVFLDDLWLAADSVIGEVNHGWDAAIQMLGHERAHIGQRRKSGDDPGSWRSLARALVESGREEDPTARHALADVYVAERAGELFAARLGEEARAGGQPGARGSVGKIAAGRHARQLADAISAIVGSRATAWHPDDPLGAALAKVINDAPRPRIAGGTDEIQRTIIGERVLGLPKEPKP